MQKFSPEKENEAKIVAADASARGRITASRVKRRILKHVLLIRLLLIAGVVAVLYIVFLLFGTAIKRTGAQNYFNLVSDFVLTPPSKIKSFEGRTNVLILGKGGAGHEAPELTDTMIFVSVSQTNPSITLISIPRDIWITQLRAKINSAYYWGNKKEEDGGLLLAKSTVEEVVGLPVHYGFVIDFSGFKAIVDSIGGIDVDVQTPFVDDQYPITGKENDDCGGDPEYKCRYETIKFEKGLAHMDGETALKFVRSRHAQGDEGTDFARSARQELVISAIKRKLLSKQILASPETLSAFLAAVKRASETDINSDALMILAKRMIEANGNVHSFVLSEDLLVNPPISPMYDNLYVFIPKDEDWSGIHKWVECRIEQSTNCD